MNDLAAATSELLVDWAALLAPHFGAKGSMDLDLRDWPGAQGPSYYNQFSHYPFLLLATGEVPGADEPTRARYLSLALRNLEYVRSITDAEFHTPHFSRGREWGRHVGEWLNYYLLCSLEVMERRQLGSAELRAGVARAVAGATDVLHRRFVEKYAVTPREFVGNHDTWHALLFYRAGRYFKRPDWKRYARDFFGRCVIPFQHPDGYWPEGHGIVVGYALTTAEAVSIYAELSGDEAAQASLGRFLGFYSYFCLPDGSTAAVIDVRMRYYRMPFLFLPPGFLGHATGRELALARVRAARTYFNANGVHDNGAQSFAFFSSFAEFVFARDAQPGEIRLQEPATLPAARCLSGPWHGYLGWQLTPEHSSRFVLDTQNFVELWHRDAGYLVGTGGSKFMPRFSTVRRTNGGRAYLPDRAEKVRASDAAAEIALHFGGDEFRVELTLADQRATIAARAAQCETGATYEFGVLLALRRGEKLVLDEVEETIDPTVLIHAQGGPRPVATLRWRGLTWQLPAGAQLDYPVVPHNSYTQDGLPAPDDYVGRLSFPLTAAVKAIHLTR